MGIARDRKTGRILAPALCPQGSFCSPGLFCKTVEDLHSELAICFNATTLAIVGVRNRVTQSIANRFPTVPFQIVGAGVSVALSAQFARALLQIALDADLAEDPKTDSTAEKA